MGQSNSVPFEEVGAGDLGGIAGGLSFEPLAEGGPSGAGLRDAPQSKPPSTYSNGTPLDPFPVSGGNGSSSSSDTMGLQWLGGGVGAMDGSTTRPGNDTGLSTAVAEFLKGLPDLGYMVK